MKNVKQVFEEHCGHMVFDKKLIKKIQTYERDFVNKNPEHIRFFGGVLMGVDPVRFTTADQNRWFDEIMEIDESTLEADLHDLPDILAHRHVSSNVMNLSMFWMAHKFLTNNKLSQSERELGALLTILILHYKFITSTLTNWFKYNADPAIAQATYNMLTKRFGLKVVGSWGELLKQRAEATIERGGLHHKRLMNFDKDLEIVYMVNDTHGRVKSILKYIRDVFTLAQNDPDSLVKNVSATIELDGDVKVRDKTRLTTTYVRYVLDALQDHRSFVIPELLVIISKTVTTAPKDAIERSLAYMVENVSPKADKAVSRLPEVVLQHAFDYMTKNPSTMASGKDIPGLLSKMIKLYQASKTSDELILEARELGEGIAKRATGSKNKILISAVRNAILLYVLLRAFTMDHYKSK